MSNCGDERNGDDITRAKHDSINHAPGSHPRNVKAKGLQRHLEASITNDRDKANGDEIGNVKIDHLNSFLTPKRVSWSVRSPRLG